MRRAAGNLFTSPKRTETLRAVILSKPTGALKPYLPESPSAPTTQPARMVPSRVEK
ncbi:hypothetical protein NXZ84_14940 [Mechercharimyces sp. CAU 1602]|nr:hypothetical protein [Mechercharimyces sp. CAU 1602]